MRFLLKIVLLAILVSQIRYGYGSSLPLERDIGEINAHCFDSINRTPLDSVKLSIYKGNVLITTSYSTNTGFCEVGNLIPGEYKIVFTNHIGTILSTKSVTVNAGSISNLEMPLAEVTETFFQKYFAESLAMIIVIGLSIVLILYSVFRKLGGVV
jgi:hypothetical protein